MKEIPLTKGRTALVDDADYNYLNQWKWQCSQGYAVRAEGTKSIIMHRVIMDAPKGTFIDHINGTRCDNRRDNLRFCSNAENIRNIGLSAHNTSGCKGVTRFRGKWLARITVDRVSKHLGIFADIHDAARAYNEAALEYHGEFAYQNPLFPYDYGYDESWRYL